MMNLTVAEFCRFNLKSRIQLLNKDGLLLSARKVYDKYLVKLYRIYRFLVEVIIGLKCDKIIKADPVLNKEIIDMYR